MADSGDGDTGDIEEQFHYPDTCSDQPIPTTEPAAQASPGQSSSEHSKAGFLGMFGNAVTFIFDLLVWYVRFIIICFHAVILALALICSIIKIGKYRSDMRLECSIEYPNQFKTKGGGIKIKKPAFKVKMHELTIVILLRAGCLVLLWLVINVSVPRLRRVTLLGSLLWKWSFLSAIVLLVYPLFIILSKVKDFIFTESEISESLKKSNLVFFMEGTAHSTIWVVYFSFLLIAWLFCVNTTISLLKRHGTWILVSFLVGAILSEVKSFVLTMWKVKLIYNKYEGKILSASCQLYFHFLFLSEMPAGSVQLISWSLPNEGKNMETKEDHIDGGRANRKIHPIEEYMKKKGARLKHIDDVATYLTKHFELSLTEDDDIPDIVPKLRQKYQSHVSPKHDLFHILYTNIAGRRSLYKAELALFKEILVLETSRESPTYEDFEKWMVDSLNNCYSVGNRINGAMEVMRILDRVLRGFIVVLVILVWLFITGFATTRVVLGLASVFLGVTFIFGDTCKTFFQGVVFSFVTHPFDVADSCIIEGKELKVKKINILTTTFFGSRSKEIIMYPNTALATMRIVLLHAERESEPELKPESKPKPYPSELEDLIEFNLPSSINESHIESLEKNIEGYIEDGIQSGHFTGPYRVSLKEIGDNNIRMGVHFHHSLNNGDESDPSEGLEVKIDKQRSKFLRQLRKFLYDAGK